MAVAGAVLVAVLLATRLLAGADAGASGRGRWRRAVGLAPLLLGPMALYLAALSAAPAVARSGVVDAPWGVALMALGIWALLGPRRHRIFASVGVIAAAGALVHSAGAEQWFAAIGWVVALVATRRWVGRTGTHARGHLAALASCGAIAVGGYVLAGAYVTAAGAGAGERVGLPPAPSGFMGAWVLLALLLAAGAGYHLEKLQGRG